MRPPWSLWASATSAAASTGAHHLHRQYRRGLSACHGVTAPVLPVTPSWQSPGSQTDVLRGPRGAIDSDTPASGQGWKLPTLPVYLGETFIGLSYQAVLALLVFHLQGTSNSNNSSTAKLPQPLLLVLAEVTMVVGFAASLIEVLLREVCWKVAAVVERTGLVAAAVSFFLMVGMLFSTRISKWVGVLCGVASLVAFMLPIIKKKWD